MVLNIFPDMILFHSDLITVLHYSNFISIISLFQLTRTNQRPLICFKNPPFTIFINCKIGNSSKFDSKTETS